MSLSERLALCFVLRPLPDSGVKGVSQPLRIHALDGESGESAGASPRVENGRR